MPMSRDELIQHLTPPPGISMPPYPAVRDRIYRWSLLATALSMVGVSVAEWGGLSHLLWITEGCLALSIVVAGWTFLVWLRSWRYAVRILVILGAVLWPWWPLIGLAFTILASAIIAAKETHCFHFPTGRIIPWMSLVLGGVLVIHPNHLLRGLAWSVLTLLWVHLVYGRWHLPLFQIDPAETPES